MVGSLNKYKIRFTKAKSFSVSDKTMKHFRKGEIITVEIPRAYAGAVEECDLKFADGSVAVKVPYDCFIFYEGEVNESA